MRLLKVLANEQRLTILYELSEKEMSVYEIAKKLNLSYPLTFLHLKQLKDVGLVSEVRSEGGHGPLPTKFYKATDFRLLISPQVIKKIMEGA